jgi:CHAT domain-containing protein
MTTIKTLFLAANPKGTTHLALDEEIREITTKIRLSESRDILEVVSAWAVRPDDLLQYLNQHQPQIVHFSGHGSSAGEIILVDQDGRAKPVSPAALKALFTTLKDNIQLVVLNACYSRRQGEAINEVIDYVVGMKTAIGDEAAIVFAASFYRALGFERTIQEAFDQARTALLLEGIPEEDTPELLVRQEVSADRQLVRPPGPSEVDQPNAQPGGTTTINQQAGDNATQIGTVDGDVNTTR